MDRTALRLERDAIARMVQEGLLTPEVERDLVADVRLRQRALDPIPALDLGLDVARLVAEDASVRGDVPSRAP